MAQERFLDIGGGPDFGINSTGKPLGAQLTAELLKYPLAAVKKAQANPIGLYYVMDQSLPRELASIYEPIAPNVRFVEFAVPTDPGIQIPFESDQFTEVDLNFIFTPLSAEHWIGKFHTADEWMLKELRTLAQIPAYVNALCESARVLKKGGQLSIRERTSRMEHIQRLLSIHSSNPFGGSFMRELGLTFQSQAELDDYYISPTAVLNLRMIETFTASNDTEKVARHKVITTQFVKS